MVNRVYIYCITILHPEGNMYYVGRHKYKDGVDEAYRGSCCYGSHFGFVRWGNTRVGKVYWDWCNKYGYFQTILEECEDCDADDAETYWIDQYLTMYGSRCSSMPNKSFLKKYGYGRCLNGDLGGHVAQLSDPEVVKRRNDTRTRLGHWNYSQLTTPESRGKSVETRRKLASYSDMSSCHSAEAEAKALEDRIKSGCYERNGAALSACGNSKEARSKAIATRYAKLDKWKCSVSDIELPLCALCKAIGSGGYAYWLRHKDLREFEFKGISFKLIN